MYARLAVGAFFVMLIATNGLQSYPFTVAQVQGPNSSGTVDAKCINKMTNEMHSKALTLDNVKAISMATNQDEFKSKTQGYTLNYSSIFNTWKLDTTNCSVQWNDVNVGYQLYNGTHYVKTIVVTLDPALTKTIKVDEQVGAFHTPTTKDNGIWSGYDLSGTGSSLPNVLSSVIQSYALPAVNTPTGMSNTCRTDLGPTFQPCDTAIWTGLENVVGATDGELVQAGSDGKIDCSGSTCTKSYFLWYELYPNSEFTCSNAALATGNTISINVTNDIKAPGGSATLFDLSLQDLTGGWGCTATHQSYSGLTAPKYAPFILERAQEDPRMKGYPATLADFSSSSPITIKAETYYNSGYNVISSTSGEKWTMSNQNNANVSPSSISSGAFNETWSTSAGTDKTCVPPRTGDLVISGSCTLPNNADAQANVEVQSGSNVLTIPNGFKLTIPFSTNHLLVHGPTGGVLIKHGGTISTH